MKKRIHFIFFLILLTSFKIFGGTTPFITTWKVDNEEDFYGIIGNNQVIINISGTGYNYTVDWGDGTTSNHTDRAIHTYITEGIYTVSITVVFPRMNFLNNGRLLTIEQWGDNKWDSMKNAFNNCYNLKGNYTDAPDLSNVTNMEYMFYGASAFNQYIANWDVSNVTNMKYMFSETYSFNQNINNWDVSNVTNMEGMFSNARVFNQNIGNWDVSKVTRMNEMFSEAYAFNQDIGNWSVKKVTFMDSMFSNARLFNQDISNWDVRNVTNMEAMFSSAQAFNQEINIWNVSKVTKMSKMFHLAADFNKDISSWNVGNVDDMTDMFSHAFKFNQDIGSWNVSNVYNMNGMFYLAKSFNQDIGDWDVGKVRDMRLMFAGATLFDQDLGNWNVGNVIDMSSMFTNVKLSIQNYDSLLIGWSNLNLQSDVTFVGGFSQYCAGKVARNKIIKTYNWIIKDYGTPAPIIEVINNQEGLDKFKLPQITGKNLTGNEKYYTAPNAKGNVYNAGDIIHFNDYDSYPITLYAYDVSNGFCSSEEAFELILITSTLSCTLLTTPIPDSKNVSVETELVWDKVSGAEGYKISIGTNSSNNNILESTDVGNVLNYDFFRSLPQNTTIFVKITSYNSVTENLDCNETHFTTETLLSSGIPKYFTPNNDGYNDIWIVPDPLNRILYINIYNRYGKLLKQIADISNGWDGIYLNNKLPTNDYWYTIQYKNGELLNGHFSLKR